MRYKRRKRRKRKLNGYLKASFALITLNILLGLTAVVLWRAEGAAQPAQSVAGVTPLVQESVPWQNHTQASGSVVLRQETTMHGELLQEDVAEDGFVFAPQSGVLVADERAEDAPDGEAENEASAEPEAYSEDAAPADEAENADDAESAEEPEEALSHDAQRTGRIFFVGDSRTIDLFADSDSPVEGEVHDGVIVYAKHGHGYSYLEGLLGSLPLGADDTLVTWMGANDRGNYSSYCALYDRLLAQGVRLVVCTVGPTTDYALSYWDAPYYTNDKMQGFNNGLTAWANANGVPVIDLYAYVSNYVQIDGADGIHYLPRPHAAMWSYILENIGLYAG